MIKQRHVKLGKPAWTEVLWQISLQSQIRVGIQKQNDGEQLCRVMKSLTQFKPTGANLSHKSLEGICSWLAFYWVVLTLWSNPNTSVSTLIPDLVLAFLHDQRLNATWEDLLLKKLDWSVLLCWRFGQHLHKATTLASSNISVFHLLGGMHGFLSLLLLFVLL